jgi:hypothetical protein
VNWIVESYITDTGDYLVVRRGDLNWVLLVNGAVTDGFKTEGDAITAAEEQDKGNAIGIAATFEPNLPASIISSVDNGDGTVTLTMSDGTTRIVALT